MVKIRALVALFFFFYFYFKEDLKMRKFIKIKIEHIHMWIFYKFTIVCYPHLPLQSRLDSFHEIHELALKLFEYGDKYERKIGAKLFKFTEAMLVKNKNDVLNQ